MSSLYLLVEMAKSATVLMTTLAKHTTSEMATDKLLQTAHTIRAAGLIRNHHIINYLRMTSKSRWRNSGDGVVKATLLRNSNIGERTSF